MTSPIGNIPRVNGFKKFDSGAGGFTLIETILAGTILSVGLVFLLTGLLSVLDGLNYGRNRLWAGSVLQEKINEAEQWLNLAGPLLVMPNQRGCQRFGTKDFFWERSVQLEDEQTQLYEISVRIEWKEGGRFRVLNESQTTIRWLYRTIPEGLVP